MGRISPELFAFSILFTLLIAVLLGMLLGLGLGAGADLEGAANPGL